MPTVPRLGTRGGGGAAPAARSGPSPKLAKSTPEERERDNPRLSVYDDLIAATAHLSAAERLAIRLPAIMSDPAAWGAGQDLAQVVKQRVPAAEDEAYAEGQ